MADTSHLKCRRRIEPFTFASLSSSFIISNPLTKGHPRKYILAYTVISFLDHHIRLYMRLIFTILLLSLHDHKSSKFNLLFLALQIASFGMDKCPLSLRQIRGYRAQDFDIEITRGSAKTFFRHAP